MNIGKREFEFRRENVEPDAQQFPTDLPDVVSAPNGRILPARGDNSTYIVNDVLQYRFDDTTSDGRAWERRYDSAILADTIIFGYEAFPPFDVSLAFSIAPLNWLKIGNTAWAVASLYFSRCNQVQNYGGNQRIDLPLRKHSVYVAPYRFGLTTSTTGAIPISIVFMNLRHGADRLPR